MLALFTSKSSPEGTNARHLVFTGICTQNILAQISSGGKKKDNLYFAELQIMLIFPVKNSLRRNQLKFCGGYIPISNVYAYCKYSCQTPNGLPTGFELCFPMESQQQQSPSPKSNVFRVARQLIFIMQPRFYLTKRFLPKKMAAESKMATKSKKATKSKMAKIKDGLKIHHG